MSAVRTPMGKYKGAFKDVTACELGSIAVKEAVKTANIFPSDIDEVIFAKARQAGQGPNIARQISVKAGIPYDAPAFTVNKTCGCGLKTLILAYQSIKLNDANVIIAGGVESMSRVPYILERDKYEEQKLIDRATLVDGMYRDGLFCPLSNMVMGEIMEGLAEKYRISREEQDKYALLSHQKAVKAVEERKFDNEIVPVEILEDKIVTKIINVDEHPRKDTSLEKLAELPPVFKKDGTITAGNSSKITDGAAALVLMQEKRAMEIGIEPLAYIESYTIVGLDPKLAGMGPVPSTLKLLSKTKTSLDDYDIIELGEGFAAQVLAVNRELQFPDDRTNVNGGTIALGHPIGCTSARMVVTLVHEMEKRDAERGLVTLGISGGMGMAMSIIRD